MLQPVQRMGRPPSSYVHASLKGQAVATVELLVQRGFDLREARQVVADELTNLGVRPDRGLGATVKVTTLRNWRDEILADVGRHGAAAVNYDWTLAPENVAKFSSMSREQARNHALGELAHWVKSLLPGAKT